MIKVKWSDKTITVPKGSTLWDVAQQLNMSEDYVVARINNTVQPAGRAD